MARRAPGETVPEIDDPIADLSHKSIARRAAGGRSLSLHGAVDQIPKLLEMARDDSSPAVRLITCSAAADILSRHRTGKACKTLKTKGREELLELINRLDPGTNACVFSVLACLDLPQIFHQMAVGLRDPRGSVRLGAAVGLWRHVLSIAQLGNTELEGQVVTLLRDPRLPSDSQAELARICAAGGYQTAIPGLSLLDLSGVQAELVASCIEVLENMDSPVTGSWWSDGRDAGEVSAESALPRAGLFVARDGGLMASAGCWSWTPRSSMRGVRRMFYRRVGQPEAEPGLQCLKRTWFQYPATLLDMVDVAMDVPRLQVGPEACIEGERARHIIRPLLPESSDGLRARGLLALGAGDLEQAYLEFGAAIAATKTSPDTWFLLGETCLSLGDEAGAKEAWTKAVAKARRKKDWQVARARARLD